MLLFVVFTSDLIWLGFVLFVGFWLWFCELICWISVIVFGCFDVSLVGGLLLVLWWIIGVILLCLLFVLFVAFWFGLDVGCEYWCFIVMIHLFGLLVLFAVYLLFVCWLLFCVCVMVLLCVWLLFIICLFDCLFNYCGLAVLLVVFDCVCIDLWFAYFAAFTWCLIVDWMWVWFVID